MSELHFMRIHASVLRMFLSDMVHVGPKHVGEYNNIYNDTVNNYY